MPRVRFKISLAQLHAHRLGHNALCMRQHVICFRVAWW